MEKILLTGASSGIGRATAKELAKAGYRVVACVRQEKDRLEGENIETALLDVTDDTQIKSLFIFLKEQNVKLTGIINNAGIALAGVMEYPDLELLRYQLEVNALAPLNVATTFLPLMDKGKIINISSVSSSFVYPFIGPYCASKRLMDTLFQSLANEIAGKDIKIVSIKPGVIKTPIWEKSLTLAKNNFQKLPEGGYEKYQKQFEKLLSYTAKSVENALSVDKVSKKVLQILRAKSPRSSYNVGIGAHFGEILGKLSPDAQRKLIKLKF